MDVQFSDAKGILKISMKFQPSFSHRLVAVAAIAGAGIVLSGAPAQAQTTEMDALRAQLAELQTRLDKLAAQQDVQQKTLDNAKPVVSTKTPIRISGLLQVHALDYLNQGGTSTTRTADTFRLRRGELRITAPQITDKVSATLMIDPAKDTTSSRARNNILQEIVVSYALDKQNSFDLGQFKIPVGYESLVSTSALPFVERPLIFTARDPFDGGYGDVRDTGLQLNSKFSKDFNLRLGVFNGVGDRQNALALSDNKAILGRLDYNGVKNLTLGISGGLGKTGVSATSGTTTQVRRANRDLFNLFAAYNKGKIYAASEYLRGNAVPITLTQAVGATPAVTAAGRDISGYYGAVGYMFTPKLQGLFRYDNLDTNRSTGNSTLKDYTLGLNYYLKGNEAKVQLNVVNHDGDAGAAGIRKGTELRTAFQASF